MTKGYGSELKIMISYIIGATSGRSIGGGGGGAIATLYK